jgi:catechol 2,3-dioxygenase-like lactoylglutathione lyase family enzyme
MAFHHVALATRDSAATHRFYTELMGFELVKVVVGPTPGEHGGWSKHFFYATNPTASREVGLMAFWELHDNKIGDDYPVDVNAAMGRPDGSTTSPSMRRRSTSSTSTATDGDATG